MRSVRNTKSKFVLADLFDLPVNPICEPGRGRA
jgi:hypothetical protein